MYQSEANLQKQLGIFLDNRLSFEENLKIIFNRFHKMMGLLRKLHNILPRSALLTIYKDFVGPYPDYGNIICDQAYNATFDHRLKLTQYTACLH